MSASANLVDVFQDFKSIYGFCPRCDALVRLNDVTLYHDSAPPRTPFDDLDSQREQLARSEERFQGAMEELRERARRRGRLEMERRLRRLISFFKGHRIDLHDLKLLFHPVDYVVFRGMSKDTCSAVHFLDCEPASRTHEILQRSIEKTISAGNVSWITMRISEDGRVNCT